MTISVLAILRVCAVSALLFLLPKAVLAETYRLQEPAREYNVSCDGIADIMFPAVRMTRSEADQHLAQHLYNEDGIPTHNYGSKGIRISPWQVSFVGLLHLTRFCESKDFTDLKAAIHMREWLMGALKPSSNPPSQTGLLRLEYDFANEPFADAPGWGSAFDQSSAIMLALLVRPTNDEHDLEKLRAALLPYLTHINDGGFISSWGVNGSIFWEEVATTVPSRVVNGHIITAWYIDKILDRLPPELGDLKGSLIANNKRAKHLIVELADQIYVPPKHVRYDFRDLNKPNLVTRDHYAWRVEVEGAKWLIKQGYPLEKHLSEIESLLPSR